MQIVSLLSFSCLDAVAKESKTPEEIRGKHLIASSTMMRIMSDIHHKLANKGISRDRIVSFFEAIEKSGATPLDPKTTYGRIGHPAGRPALR